MIKRRLGKTGHMSSIITFGGYALLEVKQKEADAAIEMAINAGINHCRRIALIRAGRGTVRILVQKTRKQFFPGL